MEKLSFYERRSIQHIAIRAAVFILVGFWILSVINPIMVHRAASGSSFQFARNFYSEGKDTLDAVYIGSSATHTAWLAPLAWNRYGIAISSFSFDAERFIASEYLIKEARKTQPNALYIVPIQAGEDVTSEALHILADNMPLSWNKIQLVEAYGDLLGIDWSEQLEYLFPLIRYHSRWNALGQLDFVEPLSGFHGAFTWDTFLRTSTDVSSSYCATEHAAVLSDSMQSVLKSLLNYCTDEHVDILFVLPAGLITNEHVLAEVNSMKNLIESYGYPVLSLRSSVNGLALDLTKDYYNSGHTNIHGAIKITDYLSRYLIENYGFEDKRGDPAYSSWDEAYTKYTDQYASAYTLDVEWEGDPRDFTLAAPTVKTAVTGQTITVSWNAIPKAEGYRIYSKDAPGNSWQIVDMVDAKTLSYDDSGRESGTTYYYTVIPYRRENSIRYWGDYDFAGVTAKALLPPPKLLSLEGIENDLTLSWKRVQGADSYVVFRKVPSKSWVQVADVGDDLLFTDTNMLSDMPYQYTVQAYYFDDEGNRVWGSYDTNGLLYTPELKPFEMEVIAEENGSVRLTWDRIEGIQGYTIYRKTQNSDWERLTTGNLSADSTEFCDITVQAGEWYTYKAEAYIRIGGQERIYILQPEPEWITTKDTMYDISMPEIVYLEQIWDQVHIVWQATDGAASYTIYRRALTEDGSWSDWKSIKSSVQETVYLDKPPSEGEYQYLIQSFFTRDGLTYYGEFDEKEGYTIIYSNIAG